MQAGNLAKAARPRYAAILAAAAEFPHLRRTAEWAG